MSNLIRWEPAREMMTLRDAMDRLFDDAFTRPPASHGRRSIFHACCGYVPDR